MDNMSDHQAYQATPPEELHRQLMDSNVPKTEPEHYAASIIEKQQELIDKFRKIVAHVKVEETGLYFICGGSEVGPDGLPDTIMVCPSYGLDGFAMYKKASEYSAPGY